MTNLIFESPTGDIVLGPEILEHCIRLGVVQAGILNRENSLHCEVYAYRRKGNKLGAKIVLKGAKIP